MTEPALPVHGGDLAFATATYGAPDGGWLDLSTGINPTPYPVPADLISSDTLHRLPSPAALARLEATARAAYGVPAGVSLTAVPGSELAIHLLPGLAPLGARPFILSPIYGGHTAAWATATPVTQVDAIPDGAIVILANPNNPDGRVLTRDALLNLATRVAWLIVDEAFAEVAPDTSLVPALPENALVLRSIGKFYGLAGVRLGFAIGSAHDTARIARALGDWPVSGPAIAAGTAALGDIAWRDSMRARLRDEAAALRGLLVAHGRQIIGGTDLFVLIEMDDAYALHSSLARQGIWTRAFADNPQWLRIGLPGVGFARLDQALKALR